MKTQILTNKQVESILKRMAYQIYEQNFKLKAITIADIGGQGSAVADRIQEILKEISKLKITRIHVEIDKTNPDSKNIHFSKSLKDQKGQTIVMIDDVLNTGRTMSFALIPFLENKVGSIQIAVLVDRSHKHFPLAANYIGIALSTTLQEHVSVVMEKAKINVYLE